MKKIAILLASNENTSVTRCAHQLSSEMSIDAEVTLFTPSVNYFECYLYTLLSKISDNLNLIFRISQIRIFRIIYYYFIKYSKYNKQLNNHFSENTSLFNPALEINLRDYDYVILFQSYLLPSIKSDKNILFIFNADYINQAQADYNKNGWWSYCLFLAKHHKPTFFTNSQELLELYINHGFQINGVIPDGPSITNFEFPAEMACSRSDIGIYFHASSNKGYLYGRDALDASMRELNLKGILLGSNSNNFCSDLYTNFGMLEYIKYLFALKNFKVFVYMSGSDGFESPPIDALLAGCIVISSCTPGAKFIAKFTNRILLLPKINQVNLTKSIKDSLRNFTPISAIEFENILRAANSHSVTAGAQKILSYIQNHD